MKGRRAIALRKKKEQDNKKKADGRYEQNDMMPKNRRIRCRHQMQLPRKKKTADKHVWFDDKWKQIYTKEAFGAEGSCPWENTATTETAHTSIGNTHALTSYLSGSVRSTYDLNSEHHDDASFDGDDELGLDNRDEEINERRSEASRLYKKLKEDLDSDQDGCTKDRLKKSATALACAISIHTELFPAIKSASLITFQGADKGERQNATMDLVCAFDKFHDDYIALDQSNISSMCHSREARSALNATQCLLEESMTAPPLLGSERGWHIITALTSSEVQESLKHFAEELLYDYSVIEKLNEKYSAADTNQGKNDCIETENQPTRCVPDCKMGGPTVRQGRAQQIREQQDQQQDQLATPPFHIPNRPLRNCCPDPLHYTPNDIKSSSAEASVPETTIDEVYNDTLKVVLIGAPGSGKSLFYRGLKRERQRERTSSSFSRGEFPSDEDPSVGVSVRTWSPSAHHDKEGSFFIFSEQELRRSNTAYGCDEMRPRFSVWDSKLLSDGSDLCPGSHYATQTLFFSSNSLYVLFWDMGVNNQKTWRCGAYPKHATATEQEMYSSSSDEGGDFSAGSDFVQADHELENNIAENVLFWVDCIRKLGLVGTAILPVASFDDEFDQQEAERRCEIMKRLLIRHCENAPNSTDGKFPKFVVGEGLDGRILRINTTTMDGIDCLQGVINRVSGSHRSSWGHLGTRVSCCFQKIQTTLQRLKQEFKIVKVDHVLAEVNTQYSSNIELTKLHDSLCFLSDIGEVLYFGKSGRKLSANDCLLASFVILRPSWLASAISCILRQNLESKLADLHYDRFNEKQHQEESFISWWNDTLNCTAVTPDDCVNLWQSMKFMGELEQSASSQGSNKSYTLEVFGYLQYLLVHLDVLIPITIKADPAQVHDQRPPGFNRQYSIVNGRSPPTREMEGTRYFLVPGLFPSKIPRDVWTYRPSNSLKIILSHSWLFENTVPPGLLERIFASVIIDLSNTNCSSTRPQQPSGVQNFNTRDCPKPVCQWLRLRTVKCWKTAFMLEVEACSEVESNQRIRGLVKIFVNIHDKNSEHCVSSHTTSRSMKRLVVSAKGLAANTGALIWTGGLDRVVRSVDCVIQRAFGGMVTRHIICPYCLEEKSCKSACVWEKDSIKNKLDRGVKKDWCRDGHSVDLRLLCGKIANAGSVDHCKIERNPFNRINHLFDSVVLVGLWDDETKAIKTLGSGFIADSKRKLVVTAAHTLIQLKGDGNFGEDYTGLKHGRAVIGMINKSSSNCTGSTSKGIETEAIFRYFAEIVSKDTSNVDACVLRITEEMDRSSIETEDRNTDYLLRSFYETSFEDKCFKKLKMANDHCGHDENIWVLGYSQEKNALSSQLKISWNTHVESVRGYVMRYITDMQPKKYRRYFQPQEEIVIVCSEATVGHSGGPCVNQNGDVIGILRCGDPIGNRRYLVPARQLKMLLKQAKQEIQSSKKMQSQINKLAMSINA